MQYLKLTLSSVLQYYSSKTSTTLRETYTSDIYPTRNAILGLISAAFGFSRDSTDKKTLDKELHIKYKSLSTPILMEDFQTIRPLKSSSTYVTKSYEKRTRFRTVDGGYRDSALIKRVQYLQDAKFEVYIGGNEKLLRKIYDAIRDPVYDLHLGKRSCTPNAPIVTDFVLYSENDLFDVYDCA